VPPRWRSRLMSKVGRPGALPAKGTDGAAHICHLVLAALGIGTASPRTSNANTPFSAAASAKRRVDVRSTKRALPCVSNMTALAAFDRMASAAARKASRKSVVWTRHMRDGLPPMADSPSGYSRPDVWRSLSPDIQKIPASLSGNRHASSRANAAATCASAFAPPKNSCSPAWVMPPCKRSSTRGAPMGNKGNDALG